MKLNNGLELKEFPIYVKSFFNKQLVFSGGGFFRLFPYSLINYWAKSSPYIMTYFHTRDFDPDQPMIPSLPFMRKFKSYVGLSTSFAKFQKLLNNYDFVNMVEADKLIDWEKTRIFEL